MIDSFTCPNCNHIIDSSDNNCQNCGMNLAIAAVIAEGEMAERYLEATNINLSPEILVPRLGDYLVERGMLSKEQLYQALNIQKLGNEKGDYKLLGRILIQENFIDQTMLDTAITEQIATLQNALKKSNSELEDRVQERTNELRHALQQITKLNKLKTNFISNISHELRTPLAHMIGYIDLIKDNSLGPLTDDQAHAVNVLLKSYNRLHSLIDELLQFSMLSQGEMSISQTIISTEKLIDKAISHAHSLSLEKKVNLQINYLSKNIQVYADQDKISWVLGELIENGIKFNQEGGQVSVKISSQNGLVNFQVSDNGIGINEDLIEEIFEPFHQLDGSSTRRQGGTGIGLTLAKQIVEAHGSKLKVQSIKNKGTRFEFSLPEV
jgi:signal transduction histidine kinase